MTVVADTSPCHCENVEGSSPTLVGEHRMSGDVSTPSNNFDCSICLDTPQDPVVTMCGHLFCWPCLHQWITVHSVLGECPVCKACINDNIIPLYGRGRAGFAELNRNIPRRPSAHRTYVAAASVPPAGGIEHHRFITHTHHAIPRGHFVSSVPAAAGHLQGRHSTCSAAFALFPAMFRFLTSDLSAYSSGVSSGSAYIGSRTSEHRRLNAKQEFVLNWFLILLACFGSLCFLLF